MDAQSISVRGRSVEITPRSDESAKLRQPQTDDRRAERREQKEARAESREDARIEEARLKKKSSVDVEA